MPQAILGLNDDSEDAVRVRRRIGRGQSYVTLDENGGWRGLDRRRVTTGTGC